MVYEETVEGNTAAGAPWGVCFTGHGARRHLSKQSSGCAVSCVVYGKWDPPASHQTRQRVRSGVCGLRETAPPGISANTAAGMQWGVWFTGNGAPRHLSPGLALTQAQQSSQSQDGKHSPNPVKSQQRRRSGCPLNPALAARGQNQLLGRFTAAGIVSFPRLLRSSETATQKDDWIVKQQPKCLRRLLRAHYSLLCLFPETMGAQPLGSNA